MHEQLVAYRNPNPAYHADFPDIALAPDGDLVMVLRQCGPWAHEATYAFGRPLTFFEANAQLLVLRSSDGGRSFQPSANLFTGLAYDPVICTLSDGRLMAGAVVGEARPRAERARMHGVLHRHLPQLDTVITLHGMGLWFSEDSGRSWRAGEETVCVPGWENAYNLRTVFQLDDATAVMPVTIGYPWRTRYVGLIRSWDLGQTWGDPSYVAEDAAGRAHYAAGVGYWEPAMAVTPGGDMICVCVEDDRSSAPQRESAAGGLRVFQPASDLPRLMVTYSVDSGFTWSLPEDTGLRGDFPSLCVLPDGRLLLTHTRRLPEGSRVVGHVSGDGGAVWTAETDIATSPDHVFYYPNTVALADGVLVTAFMTGQPDLVRRVDVVRWSSI